MHTRNPGYQPGNYWLECPVCGFDYRFSDMRKNWNGEWVCYKDLDTRNQQDFVKGTFDRQRVPVARPGGVTSLRSTTLSSDALKGAKSIVVASASNIAKGDSIGIVFETFDETWDSSAEVIQWTFVTDDPSGTTVLINDNLWENCASGNNVYLSQATGHNFIEPTATTADDL